MKPLIIIIIFFQTLVDPRIDFHYQLYGSRIIVVYQFTKKHYSNQNRKMYSLSLSQNTQTLIQVNLDLWILALEEIPCTSYRTPSTYPSNQGINFLSRISPYLWASGFIMDLNKDEKNDIIS